MSSGKAVRIDSIRPAKTPPLHSKYDTLKHPYTLGGNELIPLSANHQAPLPIWTYPKTAFGKQNTPNTCHIHTFSSLIQTLSHIMQSSKLKCPRCDKAIGKINMPWHLREILYETLTRIACKFCEMTFKRQQDHMRHIYRCHYETDDFSTHTPSAALGAPIQDTASEEESFQPPAYKIKKANEKKNSGKLLNYKNTKTHPEAGPDT